MNEVISFLNANTDNISQFESNGNYFIIHMKNGDTVEIYTNGRSELYADHYKD